MINSQLQLHVGMRAGCRSSQCACSLLQHGSSEGRELRVSRVYYPLVLSPADASHGPKDTCRGLNSL